MHTTRRVEILHTYSLIFHPLFLEYSLHPNGLVSYQTHKILAPFAGGPLQPGLATNQYLKKSQTHFRGNSQNAGLTTNQYLKIFDPSLGETFIKHGMASTSAQNIDTFRRLHRTLPISTNLPNIEPVSLT